MVFHAWSVRETQNPSRARQLRRNATDAERLLWLQLRVKQLGGFRFRRQVAIGPYFADFVCLAAKLIVEVDGGQHNSAGKDEARDRYLREEGFVVLRVWDNEVIENLQGVCEAILQRLLAPPP
jgi:very-short-patch-repair endonuclease